MVKQKVNEMKDWVLMVLFGVLFGAMFAWGGINQW